MVEAVVADEVAIARNPPRHSRKGLDPAALEEPGRDDAAVGKDIEDFVGHARAMRAVRMLGVERQGNAEWAPRRRDAGYFSTPLITMPRVKNRWKIKKITTGMIIVIRVPA